MTATCLQLRETIHYNNNKCQHVFFMECEVSVRKRRACVCVSVLLCVCVCVCVPAKKAVIISSHTKLPFCVFCPIWFASAGWRGCRCLSSWRFFVVHASQYIFKVLA